MYVPHNYMPVNTCQETAVCSVSSAGCPCMSFAQIAQTPSVPLLIFDSEFSCSLLTTPAQLAVLSCRTLSASPAFCNWRRLAEMPQCTVPSRRFDTMRGTYFDAAQSVPHRVIIEDSVSRVTERRRVICVLRTVVARASFFHKLISHFNDQHTSSLPHLVEHLGRACSQSCCSMPHLF